MSDVWVANASPVIVLAKIGRLNLLTTLCREIWVPEAVVSEISAGPNGDPARAAIQGGWGTRATPLTVDPVLAEWGLGQGETSVLALAMERSPAVAVLDDAAARACAKVLGVPVIGTLGVILRAKKLGFVSSAVTAIQELRQVGHHLDDDAIQKALKSVGESW